VEEQSRSDRAWETAPAGATISGPTFGARPGAQKYASSRSGVAALPHRPPPSPHFSGPREPGVGTPIGRIAPAWYKAKWFRVAVALVVGLVVAMVAINTIGGGSGKNEGIEAAPGAPAPAGYRMVKTDSYQFAIPRPWNTKALDAQVMTASAATAGSGDHELTVATDPATRDTVNVVPYRASGDPLQKRVLAEFEADFRDGVAGTQIVSLRVNPAKVHGFPAGRLSASVIGRDGPAKVISTIVDTDAGLFQITVTSANAQRAATLDSLVLPTFDIR
jgi:hypothetical protein